MSPADDSDVVYIFFHIPKTGGITLRSHFAQHLRHQEDFIHLGPWGRADSKEKGLAQFYARPPAERSRVRVICGHGVTHRTAGYIQGRRPVHITFLRDPAALVVSSYNFAMKLRRDAGQSETSFERWLDDTEHEMMCAWLVRRFMCTDTSGMSEREVFDRAVEVLGRFDFVADTERMDEFMCPILRRVGVPTQMARVNAAGRGRLERLVSLTPELGASLRERFPWELRLYEQMLSADGHGADREASDTVRE